MDTSCKQPLLKLKLSFCFQSSKSDHFPDNRAEIGKWSVVTLSYSLVVQISLLGVDFSHE